MSPGRIVLECLQHPPVQLDLDDVSRPHCAVGDAGGGDQDSVAIRNPSAEVPLAAQDQAIGLATLGNFDQVVP